MEGNLEIDKEGNYVLISINPKLYPIDVIYSAAYMFTDNNYVLVDGDPNEEVIVELRPKEKNQELERLAREFNNELINYSTYATQAVKNAKLRETILQRVLLTNKPGEIVSKQPGVSDSTGYLESEAKPWKDELEIAKPWEEKYGKGKNRQEKK